MNANVRGVALGVIGAVGGAYAGAWLTWLVARQGFYAIMLPGALAGIVCGWLSGRRSRALAAVCAVVGLAAGVLTEWWIRPFLADDSLGYFLRHLHQLTTVTQILIVAGAALGCWFGLGRPVNAERETRNAE